MTKTLQLLRGTTAQNNSFTGHVGELTVDTTTNELRLHDGSTAGGHVIPNKNFLGGGTAGTLLTNSGTPGTVSATSIDATPTDGSNNPVSSNGVYDVLVTKADAATTLSGYGITDGANTALSNLTTTGKEKIFRPGMTMPFAGSTAPDGWLVCDGSAISRSTYAGLFSVISTTYGTGDGSTTFNLPNLTNRVPMQRSGMNIGDTSDGSLPNIKGTMCSGWGTDRGRSGAFSGTWQTAETAGLGHDFPNAGSDAGWQVAFNANKSSTIYNDSTTAVYPKQLVMNFIIKY